MALASTQPLTEMSTRSNSWGKGGRCERLTTLPPSCAVVMKSGNLYFLEPSGPLQVCNGTDLPNLFIYLFNGSRSVYTAAPVKKSAVSLGVRTSYRGFNKFLWENFGTIQRHLKSFHHSQIILSLHCIVSATNGVVKQATKKM